MWTRWTERRFNFGFASGDLPMLMERLQHTAPRIEELTNGKSDAELSRTPEGKWSIKQHVGHLIDLETLHEARVVQFGTFATQLKAADMQNKATYEADHNARSIAELINAFRSTRAAFIRHIRELPAAALTHKALHPRLQENINVMDLAHFVCEHDTHHLMLISGLL